MSPDYSAEIYSFTLYLLSGVSVALVTIIVWVAKKVKLNQETLFDITRKQGVKIATQGTQIEDIKENCRERQRERRL